MDGKQNKTEPREPFAAVAEAIVRGRSLVFLLFAVAAVFCVLTLGRVRVNSDLTAFLPKDTETRRGLAVMDAEFTTYGSARILIEEIASADATELAERIGGVAHVAEVGFDTTEAHYKDGNALISLSFDEGETGTGARKSTSISAQSPAPRNARANSSAAGRSSGEAATSAQTGVCYASRSS